MASPEKYKLSVTQPEAAHVSQALLKEEAERMERVRDAKNADELDRAKRDLNKYRRTRNVFENYTFNQESD